MHNLNAKNMKEAFELVALLELQELLTKSLLSAKAAVLNVSCPQNHVTLIFSLLENIVLSAWIKKKQQQEEWEVSKL